MHQMLFDVTELSKFDKGTGIQRVTRAVLQELRKSPPLGWTILAVWGDPASGQYRHAAAYERRLAGDPSTVPAAEAPMEAGAGDIFISTDLAYNIDTRLVAELERFKRNGAGIFAVVYDLIPIRYPEWFEGTNDWFEGNDYLRLFDYWLESFSRISTGLICDSLAVQKDVERWFEEQEIPRNSRPLLGFFHPGSDIAASLPTSGLPADARDTLGLLRQSPTFLMVGTIEPRKGYDLALEAFDRLWASGRDVNLVFVGRAGWKVDALVERVKAHGERGRRLFWFSGISDEYLGEIYDSATALLSLSRAEGFGLPNVEAAAHRLPVISRDIEVFREVCAPGTLFLSPDVEARELAAAIDTRLKEPKARHLPGEAPAVHTWTDATRQLMAMVGHMSQHEFVWSTP